MSDWEGLWRQKRKDYTFWCQFIEKPSITSGCVGNVCECKIASDCEWPSLFIFGWCLGLCRYVDITVTSTMVQPLISGIADDSWPQHSLLLLSKFAGRWLYMYKGAATNVMRLHTMLAVILCHPHCMCFAWLCKSLGLGTLLHTFCEGPWLY